MNEESGIRCLAGIGYALFALFFGGCSAIFAYDEFFGNGFGAYTYWIPGLILGALFAYAALRQFFPSKQPRTAMQEEPGSANKPSSPPDP